MRSRIRVLAFVLVPWLLIGALQGTQTYLGVASELPGRIAPYPGFVLWQVLAWSGWAILTPFVVWLSRRVPVRREPRAILLHAAASVVLPFPRILVATLAMRAVRPFGASTTSRPLVDHYLGAIASFFTLDLLVYWAIAGVVTALDSRRRLRERELAATRAEGELASARLANLQLQLQPHFLFNTLHSVAGLIRAREPEAAIGMISGLSDLLRYALDRAERPVVPLEEELKVAAEYLGIQRTRFSDRLTFEIGASDDARAALVPTLLLQPLLENAVEHGVARSSTPCSVRLHAHRLDDLLVIEVRGQGPPLAPDWREREGVGLSSIRRRLETLHGPRAAIGLENGGPGEVVARVQLPFVRERRDG